MKKHVYSVIPSNLSRLKSTVIHTTVHYCNVIDSTTLPLLLFSSFILTSSILACSILSSAKTSEKANTRKMARALTCRQAGVICRRLPGNRNHRRSNVCACVQVVITTWSAVRNELHRASHASESRLKRKGESTGYPYLNKFRATPEITYRDPKSIRNRPITKACVIQVRTLTY
ncbi:hypothetical protein pdam_00015818 [Pocillopora damicornis]|uniref:Uncharacterized protein n=1 Tax=Pocillopora damicornis TaxID=46731 RepID=A0A3M6T5P8_POCDA|nr:hypothetical protein pdam_00015818 [Pocillopora damicornis]